MFVNRAILKQEILERFGPGVIGAIMLHGLVLLGFLYPVSNTLMASSAPSMPTNITIRFAPAVTTQPIVTKTPVKPAPIKQEQIKKPVKVTKAKPVKPKAVQKKIAKVVPLAALAPEKLNVIEPASAPANNPIAPISPPQQATSKIIPVVSGDSLKGRRVPPQYPARALRMGHEGVVWLRVLISESGARQDLKLHKPSKYALLNQAAIKAVKKWTFDPNIVDGRAVKSWVEIPIEFKIQ